MLKNVHKKDKSIFFLRSVAHSISDIYRKTMKCSNLDIVDND